MFYQLLHALSEVVTESNTCWLQVIHYFITGSKVTFSTNPFHCSLLSASCWLYIGANFVGALAYADDIVLLSPTPTAARKLYCPSLKPLHLSMTLNLTRSSLSCWWPYHVLGNDRYLIWELVPHSLLTAISLNGSSPSHT